MSRWISSPRERPAVALVDDPVDHAGRERGGGWCIRGMTDSARGRRAVLVLQAAARRAHRSGGVGVACSATCGAAAGGALCSLHVGGRGSPVAYGLRWSDRYWFRHPPRRLCHRKVPTSGVGSRRSCAPKARRFPQPPPTAESSAPEVPRAPLVVDEEPPLVGWLAQDLRPKHSVRPASSLPEISQAPGAPEAHESSVPEVSAGAATVASLQVLHAGLASEPVPASAPCRRRSRRMTSPYCRGDGARRRAPVGRSMPRCCSA